MNDVFSVSIIIGALVKNNPKQAPGGMPGVCVCSRTKDLWGNCFASIDKSGSKGYD